MADLNTDIRFIKGVGETRAKALEKLHIRTLGDLLSTRRMAICVFFKESWC